MAEGNPIAEGNPDVPFEIVPMPADLLAKRPKPGATMDEVVAWIDARKLWISGGTEQEEGDLADEEDLAARDTLRSPAMMAAIGVAPRFAEMSASLDRGQDRIVAVVGDLQAKQARRLARIGVKVDQVGGRGAGGAAPDR